MLHLKKILAIFDAWSCIKKFIFSQPRKKLYYKERDIFFIKMGKNLGFEQDGKGKNFARPVIVLKKFNKHMFWGIPLTTKQKRNKYIVDVLVNNQLRGAIWSQLRAFDTMRMMSKIGTVSPLDYKKIKQKIKDFL